MMSQMTLFAILDGLTSLPEDFPASLSVKPGSAEARRMTATSGRKCSALLTSPGPAGWLVKMLLASSTWHSTMCWLTWKPRATKHGRLYFRLVPSVPRTSGNESLSLPTPQAHEAGDYQYDRGNHDRARMTLTGIARMWPTPNVPNGGRQRRKGSISLTGRKPDGGKTQVDLQYAVKAAEGVPDAMDKLNPEWVEWVMGFPLGWTEVPIPGKQASGKALRVSRAKKRTV